MNHNEDVIVQWLVKRSGKATEAWKGRKAGEKVRVLNLSPNTILYLNRFEGAGHHTNVQIL